MKCPVCGTPDLLMTERQGVEIDYCPKCRGVWLDRGELDKLIERTDETPAMAAQTVQGGQGGFGRGGYDAREHRASREYRDDGDRHDDDDRHRNTHHGHDDRRRHYDRPRKKKSLFEMFDFD
ncbi:hypothetical protein PAQ31011_02349 [Pandoraea aquatica]|uniref:Transcription factor zinc-finger domain-containing protein n=1 Tax=Pandoraea aquatica TaxID=2508290 RepID=A0A5E4UYS8_9BURK|nr:zf-TFIIB domain-containing protein [Pandoraea aquatica]VVE05182.1 hypothetical protein PAQ31011_02349 [Pandoraea aquatica]